MTDVVNIGSAPNAGDGDPLHTAFGNINVAIAALQASSPITVSGLSALGLSTSTVAERPTRGTTIATITGKTSGSTLRMADPMESQFQISGTTLTAGPRMLDTGTVYAAIEEIIDTGTDVLSKITTLPITVTRDAATWPAITPTKWAGNASAGTGDGSSYANRMDKDLIAAAVVPGDIVGVCEDILDQATRINVTISGTALNPIKWYGCDSTGKRVQRLFQGIRHPYRKFTHDTEETLAILTDTDNHVTGTNVFGLGGGVGYNEFYDMYFVDQLIGFSVSAANCNHITIKNVFGMNMQRMFETTNAAYANNVLIEGGGCIMYSKGIYRWRGASDTLTLRDLYCDCMRLDGDAWGSMGAMDHTSQNVLIDNCVALHSHNDQGAGYWNADGYSIENNNNGLVVQNFTSIGHTDAGIDCKTGTTILSITGGTIGDCKRNIKCWAGVSGNGKYHFDSITLLPPHRRGGSGPACHINCNGNSGYTLLYPIEVRVKDMDLRLADIGASGYELAHEGTFTPVVYKFINVVRDALPNHSAVDTSGTFVRFMIAPSLPTGSPSLTSSSTSIPGGQAGGTNTYMPLTSNRDATYGGILVRSIGGSDGALFKVGGTEYSINATLGIAQRIEPAAPITYTGTGADAKSITLLIEDIAGNQATVPFTVNIVPDTVDHRVLDINFIGANNSQTATDASPLAHTLGWGTSAKVMTTRDPAGSLRVPFAVNGSTIGRILISDTTGDDFDIPAMWSLVVDDLSLDTAATGLTQTVIARWGITDKTFRLYVDTTGHLAFDIQSGGAQQILLDPTALSNATDYDVKIRRTLVPGPGGVYLWEMVKNGSVVSSLSTGLTPASPTAVITIGSDNNGTSNYMQGYIKRVAVYQNTPSGT